MFKNIFALLLVFTLATLWIYFLYLMIGSDERLLFPTSIPDIRFLVNLFQEYSDTNLASVILVFSSVYLYKQAFAIPGSIFLNLLAGALFGPISGFILCCILSSFGASSCFLISKYIAYAVVESYFPQRLKQFQELVDKKRNRLFYFLLSLRIFPMTPNWLLNMCSPLARVPLYYFYFSVLVGLAPYNLLTTQAGSVIGEIDSVDDIFSTKVLLSMSLLAAAMLGPALIKSKVE